MAVHELGSIRAELRAMLVDLRESYGVEEMWVFGSRARGEGRDDSDLDLMVQVPPGHLSLWDYIGLGQEIEDRLGLKVDLVERRALRAEIAPYILSEAITI